jgi:hypothetical protein
VCVLLCAVFRLIVVLFFVMCILCVLCLIVVPLPPGETPFAVTINNAHYLDKRLIDGGRVVSPTRRPHFTPRFLYFLRFLVLISVRG